MRMRRCIAKKMAESEKVGGIEMYGSNYLAPIIGRRFSRQVHDLMVSRDRL